MALSLLLSPKGHLMLKTYRYRLYPTPAQATLLQKSFGCVRWVYNQGLAARIKHYEETGQSLSCFEQMKQLTALKGENAWLGEVSSQALQQALRHLDAAYQAFFKGAGFPKFKRKNRSKKSFSCPQDCRVNFEKARLTIPKIADIALRLSRTFEGTIKTVTLSQDKAGRYHASILVEDGREPPVVAAINEAGVVGIDVGITHFATLSSGEKIDNPRHFAAAQKRLACLQRRASKKAPGGANRRRAQERVAKLHARIADSRHNFLHQTSTRIVAQNHSGVCVENLNIAGMLKNHCLAKAIADCGWSEFKEMLRLKCAWSGRHFIEIGRFAPSSRQCSCGTLNASLTLSQRTWTCGACGSKHDRDVLAACNIKHFGLENNTIQGGTRPVSLGSSPVAMGCVEPRIPPL